MTLLLHIVVHSLWICFRTAQPVGEDLQAPSEALSNLLFVMNGQFNNLDFLDKDIYGQPTNPSYFLEWDMQSVALHFFNPMTTVYLEERVEKKPIYRQILTLTDNGKGLIVLHPYNIKEEFFSQYETRTEREFSSLKMEDLSELTGCDIIMQQMDTGSYMGFWPTCTPSSFDLDVATTWSCHGAAYVAYQRNTTKSEREVVLLRKVNTIYPPTFESMGSDHYKNPCEDRS